MGVGLGVGTFAEENQLMDRASSNNMDSRNDSPSFLPPPPPSQPPSALFSSSSASSSSSTSPPPPPAQAFSQSSSLSLADGLEPLTPVIPSSSVLVQSEEHPVFRDKLVFSSSPLSSSPPSPPSFLGSPAFKAFVSSPAEPNIASSRELPSSAEPKILSFVGFAASSSASPTGMGQLGGDLSATFSSSSSQLPPGPAATSPSATTATATAAGEDSGVPRPLEALQAVPVPPFLSKTYELVDDAFLDAVVSWGPSGDSFVIWDPVEFSRTVLPRHFKHSNFSSFVRQLNTYGFHKIDTDRWEFANEDFLRGHKHLLRNIHRRRSSQVQQIGSYLGSSIEVVRSGLEGEVEKLRKDKNFLMQEVVKLQKEHLTMIHQMDTVKQRMQQTEQRQKQMVSFLAKFLQNPAFLDHLRQQKEHREIASTRIKRKFLKQPKSNQSELGSLCEGQIVKYKQTLDGVISSSMNQVMETNVPNQLPDFLFQEIEDELALVVNGQEFFQTSETGERIPAFTDTHDSSFKGKSIIGTPMDTSSAAAEYFVSFLEDVSQENLFVDALYQENEDSTLPEEKWNMNFVVGASLLNCGDDVWDKLFDEDAQKQGVEAGSSTVRNIVPGKGEDLEIDKLVGVQLSFQGHQEQVGLTKEDPLKNKDP